MCNLFFLELIWLKLSLMNIGRIDESCMTKIQFFTNLLCFFASFHFWVAFCLLLIHYQIFYPLVLLPEFDVPNSPFILLLFFLICIILFHKGKNCSYPMIHSTSLPSCAANDTQTLKCNIIEGFYWGRELEKRNNFVS